MDLDKFHNDCLDLDDAGLYEFALVHGLTTLNSEDYPLKDKESTIDYDYTTARWEYRYLGDRLFRYITELRCKPKLCRSAEEFLQNRILI